MLIEKLIGEVNEKVSKLMWRICQHLIMVTLLLIVLCVFIQIAVPTEFTMGLIKKLLISLVVTGVVLILVKPIK